MRTTYGKHVNMYYVRHLSHCTYACQILTRSASMCTSHVAMLYTHYFTVHHLCIYISFESYFFLKVTKRGPILVPRHHCRGHHPQTHTFTTQCYTWLLKVFESHVVNVVVWITGFKYQQTENTDCKVVSWLHLC